MPEPPVNEIFNLSTRDTHRLECIFACTSSLLSPAMSLVCSHGLTFTGEGILALSTLLQIATPDAFLIARSREPFSIVSFSRPVAPVSLQKLYKHHQDFLRAATTYLILEAQPVTDCKCNRTDCSGTVLETDCPHHDIRRIYLGVTAQMLKVQFTESFIRTQC